MFAAAKITIGPLDDLALEVPWDRKTYRHRDLFDRDLFVLSGRIFAHALLLAPVPEARLSCIDSGYGTLIERIRNAPEGLRPKAYRLGRRVASIIWS